jgi:gluconolactonase
MAPVRPLVLALCAAAWACPQNFTDLKIDKVAGGHLFTEGPVWSPDGMLLFSDTRANRIHQWVPGKGTSLYAEKPQGANGNAFDREGRLYTCEFRERRVTRTSKDGKVEVLVEKWEGKRLNAPNDITVRRDGHVYFTDPAFGSDADRRELDFYGVFHISPRGELDLVAKSQTRPNGITLSPNGRLLYVTDSDARTVRVYDLDRNGMASKERTLISNIEGVPDGIRTDEKGNLYVAARALFVYTPDGKPLGSVDLPEAPSNCAFGEGDWGALFITARTSVYRVRLGVKGALPYLTQ